MTPVDQVRTGYGRGQCTEAAFASILEVPLEAVPDLWAGPHVPQDAPPHEHQPLHKMLELWRWLKVEHGVMLCGARLLQAVPIVEAWRCSVELLEAGGIVIDSSDWCRYHLASGPNPDGISHYVVCDRGELVHDPNPSRRGIVAAQYIQWMVPLELVPDGARDLPSAEWREEAA